MALRQRTQAERAAIDKRAAACERPISAWQLEALRAMARAPLARGRAGWASEQLAGKYWQAQTIRSLAGRGLCSLGGGNVGRERFARITRKGREELKRHDPREFRHAWALPAIAPLPRPLNVGQSIVLALVAEGKGNYRPPRQNSSLEALHRRGLVARSRNPGAWRITAAGRKELPPR